MRSAFLSARSVLFFLALVLSSACSGAQGRLPADGPTTPEEVLSKALARPVGQTLQGRARLEAYVEKDRRSVDLLMIVKRPGGIQMQALSPSLDMLAILSTDGERFVSFERGGQQCQTGKACPRNLARLLPLPLPPTELALALLGRPPVRDEGPKALGWDDERKLYRVEIGSKDAAFQEVYVEPGTFRLVGVIFYQNHRRTSSLQYEAGSPYKALRFRSTTPEVDVSLQLRDVQVDEAVSDEVFALTCPAGMQVIELACEPPTVR